jgi:hypothetical protein
MVRVTGPLFPEMRIVQSKCTTHGGAESCATSTRKKNEHLMATGIKLTPVYYPLRVSLEIMMNFIHRRKI